MDSLKAIEKDLNKLLSEIRGLKNELHNIGVQLSKSNKTNDEVKFGKPMREDDDGK